MTYNSGHAGQLTYSIRCSRSRTKRCARCLRPPTACASRRLPPDAALTEAEKRHAAGLMRVNHAGEIAAQGLYRGQAALSRSAPTRDFMRARRQRGGRSSGLVRVAPARTRTRSPSRLNPLWYLGSFAIGAAAAALGDELSLGFVTETERQVEGHLASHLDRLPADDRRSRQIVEQMKSDEAAHGQAARARGAASCRHRCRR